MVNVGYHDDIFLNNFVKKPQKRSSLINRGYYLRTKIVQYAIQKFITEIRGYKQVISLGAGYDTTYFQTKKLSFNNDLLFVEIDFPDVIRNKIILAKSNGLLNDINELKTSDSVLIFRSENYIAIGFDLRNVGKELTSLLLTNQVNLEENSLFLSEVVLTYLTASQSSRVLKWISHTFVNALTVIFEQMLPHDSFGEVMCRHFEKIGSPLSSIHHFPTLNSQIKRHRNLKFDECSSTDLFSFFNRLPIDEQVRIEKMELFDEFEGWHQMCMHYFALCSTNSKLTQLRTFCSELFKANQPELLKNAPPRVDVATADDVNISLQLFGHSSCAFDNQQKLFIFGGFGIPHFKRNLASASHQRLSNVSVVDLISGNIQNSFPLSIKEVLFSSCVRFPSDEHDAFLIFGGRAAPNRPSNRLQIVRPNEDSARVEEVLHCGVRVPDARWRHTSTLASRGKLYSKMIVVGGRDEARVFGDCWSLDLDNMSWDRVEVHSANNIQFQARHSHSTTFWQGQEKLVISGGLDELSRPLRSVLLLSTSGQLECLSVVPTLVARYSHTSHVVRDHLLLLVGGVFFPSFPQLASSQVSLQDRIDIIDLNTATWCRQVDIRPSVTYPIRFHGHTSFIKEVKNDRLELLVFGGGSNCFSFGTSFTKSSFMVLLSL